MDNNTLKHWGVKGMRWGVRRYQNPDGSLTAAGKKKQQDDFKGASKDYKKARIKSSKQMSDAELRSSINRLQMERQHAELTAKKKSEGAKFVEGMMKDLASSTVKTTYAWAAKRGTAYLDNLIRRKFPQEGQQLGLFN